MFVPLNELCNVLYVPSLGSQKRAWTSTQSNMSKLGCPPRSEKAAQKNKQTKNTNPQTKTPKTSENKHKTHRRDGRALSKQASLCADELGDKLILRKANLKNQTSQQDRDEGAKPTNRISSAETQDPPSQDPRDRTVKPTGHKGTFKRMGKDSALN